MNDNSSKVAKFYPANAADNPDYVLEQAVGLFSDVLILGYDKDGDLMACSSTEMAKGPELLWLIEAFKQGLMNGDYCDPNAIPTDDD